MFSLAPITDVVITCDLLGERFFSARTLITNKRLYSFAKIDIKMIRNLMALKKINSFTVLETNGQNQGAGRGLVLPGDSERESFHTFLLPSGSFLNP